MPWPFQFNRYKPGTPLHHLKAADVQCFMNFLNTVEGIGCTIQRTNANCIGWKIITSDAVSGGGTIQSTFGIYTVTINSLVLNTGYVEWRRDSGTVFTEPTSYSLDLYNSLNWIYVEFKPNMSAGTATCELKNDASGISTPKPSSDATTYRKVLYLIEVKLLGEGAIPTAYITRYHYGNVEFVGWRGY
jgi:hypothetical protein